VPDEIGLNVLSRLHRHWPARLGLIWAASAQNWATIWQPEKPLNCGELGVCVKRSVFTELLVIGGYRLGQQEVERPDLEAVIEKTVGNFGHLVDIK
jgi:hypothetical protein